MVVRHGDKTWRYMRGARQGVELPTEVYVARGGNGMFLADGTTPVSAPLVPGTDFSVAFAPAGGLAASADEEGFVAVWRADSGKEVWMLDASAVRLPGGDSG